VSAASAKCLLAANRCPAMASTQSEPSAGGVATPSVIFPALEDTPRAATGGRVLGRCSVRSDGRTENRLAVQNAPVPLALSKCQPPALRGSRSAI
jgi:hypothetical protein